MLSAIVWSIHPQVFPDSIIPVRWYGLLFACAFLIGYELLKRMFKREGYPIEWTDKALFYTMIGCIVGARLGHVIFYDLEDYMKDPIQIFMVWKGGLASHGAAIGIIIAMYLFSKKVSKKPMLWILDRVVITVASGGMLVRLGNLMNSEIIGKPTGTDWGFIFTSVDDKPRYPMQLVESVCYGIIFLILWQLYLKTNAKEKIGKLFGLFLTLIFGVRFFVEFLKENQVDFESSLPINMGQILSIPAVLAGLYFIYRANNNYSKQQIQ